MPGNTTGRDVDLRIRYGDGAWPDEESARQSLGVALDFIRSTGVDCFAPAIGNAHGMYAAEGILTALDILPRTLRFAPDLATAALRASWRPRRKSG